MTGINYPDSLPAIRAAGFSSTYKDPVIRTQMDAGPVKQRLRYTAVPKQFTGTIVVTEEERLVFETWFTGVLGFGTLRFVMQNPQTLVPEEFRFTGAYDETEMDGLYEISMPLERLP
ncbi:MAG: hypothetical protein LBI67_05675 [Treponema sp.]|jgi:hypothetical protein|nr:hypothetical protein [Treponema sp.]